MEENEIHFQIIQENISKYETLRCLCTIKLNIKTKSSKVMAKKSTITSDFESMKVGDKREYPASLSMTVRSMASMLGFKWDKVFTTQGDRERKVITVIRNK